MTSKSNGHRMPLRGGTLWFGGAGLGLVLPALVVGQAETTPQSASFGQARLPETAVILVPSAITAVVRSTYMELSGGLLGRLQLLFYYTERVNPPAASASSLSVLEDLRPRLHEGRRARKPDSGRAP